MRIGFVLGEMFAGLRRNLTMTLSVVLVTMVSLFFFGAGLLVQKQADILKGEWYDRVQVSIFMCGDESLAENCPGGAVTDAQRDALRTALTDDPLVDQVFYESKQDAFENFKETTSPTISDKVTPDQLPESFRVKLKEPSRYLELSAAYVDDPGVEEIPDQRAILQPLFTVLDTATRVSLGLAALMLLCSMMLVSTTIRLTAFSRRRETTIMRLVGASRALIQLPFVLEGVVASFVGGLLASGALWAMVNFGVSRLQSRPGFTTRLISTQDVLTETGPVIVVVGVVFAVIASLFSLRRWLKV
ncbi:cell division transport system permease protein [Kineococcus radiotolerans]|uniref:Cell division protein FtsX n=1 Tax=Kineococcus radiotolerans TaxID=131568 RepID=A0A7W4TNE0_KINRA|nr:permease-like cell division protein FtsX [Kineococcus radiotolerans]MBB2902114.1 cell division transport system permease protein [Kineococcus radiotolerans]